MASNNLLNGINDIQSTIASTAQQQNLSYHNKQIALEKELQQLLKINETIEMVADSIQLTKENLNTLFNTTKSTNKLLDLYIKITSQNNFNQILLNDQGWRGSSKDEEKWSEKLNYLEQLTAQHIEEKLRLEKETEANVHRNEVKVGKLKERQVMLKKRIQGSRIK